MKLITWNIQWGCGMDGRVDLDRIVATARDIADFDVLCLQEVADGFDDLSGSQGEDQFAGLATRLPGFSAVEGIAVDLPGGPRGRRRFGNLILSRLPVARVLRHILPWEADCETRNMPRCLLEAEIDAPFGPLRVMTTHLEYFSARLRGVQVAAIRDVIRRNSARAVAPPLEGAGPYASGNGAAHMLLTGDFNLRHEDPVKSALTASEADGGAGLVDAWCVGNPGAPHPPSFCISDQTYGPPHCCDFILVSAGLAPGICRVHYETDTRASDHQPVLIELSA